MTTTIHSTKFGRPLSVDADAGPHGIDVHIGHPYETRVGGSCARGDLINLVRSELGVLIIDAEMEPLTEWEAELLGAADSANLTAGNCEALAGYYANLAAKKRKTPPVDEQQVEALNALVHEAALGAVSPGFARRLIATGKVTVQS